MNPKRKTPALQSKNEVPAVPIAPVTPKQSPSVSPRPHWVTISVSLLSPVMAIVAAVTCVSRSVSGTCVIGRCSPQPAPFPPQSPPRLAPLCSIGSAVLWRSPTSPAHARPPFGLWPSRTGLDLSTKTHRRSPGSRACCFSACAGSTDYAGPKQLLAFNAAAVLPSSSRNGVGILCHGLFEAQSPRPLIPLSTLRLPPHDGDRKTQGQDGFAVLLSCRALSSPTTCRFIPAHSGLPVIRPESSHVSICKALLRGVHPSIQEEMQFSIRHCCRTLVASRWVK
jgi:hypothetical protein